MLPRTKFKDTCVLHTATVFMSHCSYSAHTHTRSHTHSPHVPSTADALHDLDIILIVVAQTRLTVAINTPKSSPEQESVGIRNCSSVRNLFAILIKQCRSSHTVRKSSIVLRVPRGAQRPCR